MICRSCKEGLPLRSVPDHLMASQLSRWDQSIGKKASMITNHIPIPSTKGRSVAGKLFINQLAQSLISDGYVKSKDSILDAASIVEWTAKVSSLPVEPVEEIAVFDGWVNDSNYVVSKGVPGSKKKTWGRFFF
jgi:hypothetical protein